MSTVYSAAASVTGITEILADGKAPSIGPRPKKVKAPEPAASEEAAA